MLKTQPLEKESLKTSELLSDNKFMSEVGRHIFGKKLAPNQKFIDWIQGKYCIDGMPFSFEGYEPLRVLYEDESQEIVVMKSAQCGASEWMVAYSFYFPLHFRENVFYAMPAKDQIKDFVQGRVDPRIDDSTQIQDLFVKTDNINLKQIGLDFIYYRGTQNRKQVTSADVGLVIYDEFDQIVQMHISLIKKRLGDSKYKLERKISTPSLPEFGIHREYLMTDMHEYFLQCKKCKKWIMPTWKSNIYPEPTRDRHINTPDKVILICDNCKADLTGVKGEWRATNKKAEKRGYRISKLIMPRTDLREMWVEYRDTINMQDFYNSNLGLPFSAEGGKLDATMLDACRRTAAEQKTFDDSVSQKKLELRECSMGVDVGSNLNVRVSKRIDGKKVGIYIGTVKDFDELDRLMSRFDVRRCVIDGLPETREAASFAQRHFGRVWLAYYSINDPHKTFDINRKARPMKVSINRTRAMDETAFKIMERNVVLPFEANYNIEYYEQMTAPQKVKMTDKNNNEVYKYVESGKPDHYYHAEVYDTIASDMKGGTIEII